MVRSLRTDQNMNACSHERKDFTQRWIVTDNWTYTADVTPFLSAQNGTADATLLVFYGIDTVANIVSVRIVSSTACVLIYSEEPCRTACSLGQQRVPAICVQRDRYHIYG